MREKSESNKKSVSEKAVQLSRGEPRSKMQSISEREEEILRFWRENKIFEKSLDLRKGNELFAFYDGPPFATGLPHYGHIMQSFAKDTIPRYQTMRGKYVPRRWGWDCHGLPLENIIEQELGLLHKKDIEEYGIAKFNKAAEEAVLRYADDWKRVIARIGRWVDMKHDYRTMDWTYTESVWWVFKTLYEKGLIYEGYKSMHICPRCETTLANFEVSQGYKDITDISVTVKFELADEPNTFILAWTTTPWTLPGNVALAVNPEILYSKIKFEGSYYIASPHAKEFKEFLDAHNLESIEEINATDLMGKAYKPPFDYYVSDGELKNRENGWKIYAADFVTTDEGTGIVHVAPAFGEEDMRLGKEYKLPFIQHVAMDGTFKPEVTDFAGLPVKPKEDHQKTDVEILKLLNERNLLFAKKKITHSYPFCWRCETPLLNYAASSWFVNVSHMRANLQKTAKEISWTPAHVKDGRFGKGLLTAPDWAISRTRFWGAPLPVWKCSTCSEKFVAGSLQDLEKNRVRKPNIYTLMRHGERDDIPLEVAHDYKKQEEIRISSRADANVHVTKKGLEDLRQTAEEFKRKGIVFDAIYASPFLRTQESAAVFGDVFGVSVVTDERIEELNHGTAYEGRTVAEYRAFFANPLERFTKTPEGGESLADVQRRMVNFLREIDAIYEGKRILVVSHGDPVWILEGVLADKTKEDMWMDRTEHYIRQGETREVQLKNYPFDEDGRLNMHRPYIDDIVLGCACGGDMKRILEVFDCWFESGSMPYGQRHYMGGPLEGFPADFIAESVEMTRGWFYSLHVLATALFEKPAYASVLATGTILAEDGRKMSKRLKNYPDPMDVVAKYGADALRLYIFLAPVIYGENMNFSEKGVDEVYKKVIMRLLNVLSFYEQYTTQEVPAFTWSSELHVVDKFILVELFNTKEAIEKALDEFRLDHAGRAVANFIEVLSTMYLQYSRDRFKEEAPDRLQALGSFHFVLAEFAKISAPLLPFLAEYIHQRVKSSDAKESVHFEDWPTLDSAIALFEADAAEAAKIPKIVEAILAERSSAGIPVRQPLRTAKVVHLPKNEECREVIRQRVNVESIEEDVSLPADHSAWIDLEITPELREKGMVREFTRSVQEARKKVGLKSQDHVTLEIYSEDKSLKDFFERNQKEIAHAVHADSVVFAERLGEHGIDLGEHKVSISLIRNYQNL